MNVRPLTPDDWSLVEPLVRAYPFKPYRNYRVLARKAQTAVMLAEVDQTLKHEGGFVLHLQDGAAAAIGVGRTLEWDSQFFGVPMGRIEYLLASDRRLLPVMLERALDVLAARGVGHVSARIDVADVESIAVLETSGFRLMDALVTYTTRPRKDPLNPVREVGVIREFREEDGPEVLRITEQAYKGFRGRFHLDPHLSHARCDAFYLEWAGQCIRGRMADMVLVSEGIDGQLLGFLAFRRREPVSSVGGVPIFGGGLGACRLDTPGAYAGLIRAGTVWAHDHDGVAECQTQNYNFATIRIYEAVGAHYVRADYTLHRWLGQ